MPVCYSTEIHSLYLGQLMYPPSCRSGPQRDDASFVNYLLAFYALASGSAPSWPFRVRQELEDSYSVRLVVGARIAAMIPL
jgi:hypothetical protein